MTATASRTAPSPVEKCSLILTVFPALKPWQTDDPDVMHCPSMTEREVVHTVTKRRHPDGTISRTCDCKSTYACTHIALCEALDIDTEPDAIDELVSYLEYADAPIGPVKLGAGHGSVFRDDYAFEGMA